MAIWWHMYCSFAAIGGWVGDLRYCAPIFVSIYRYSVVANRYMAMIEHISTLSKGSET